MQSSKSWLSLAMPTEWADVIIRAVKGGFVAFVVLQMKEFFDSGMFDTSGTASDGAMIAVGIFVLNAILKLMKP